jgi:hypothetical protein
VDASSAAGADPRPCPQNRPATTPGPPIPTPGGRQPLAPARTMSTLPLEERCRTALG